MSLLAVLSLLALSACAVVPPTVAASVPTVQASEPAAQPDPPVSPAPTSVPATPPTDTATATASGSATGSSATSAPSTTASSRSNVDCRKVACVALTFDDGPGPSTLQVVTALSQGGVPGTFFMIGKQVAAYPKLAKAVATGGNEIGNHTWSHLKLTTLSASGVDQQLARANAIIAKDTGQRVSLLRPPYGAMNPAVHAAARKAGLAMALWNVDTLDWKTRSTERTVAAALGGAKPGSIILMHDIYPTTAAAVPGIIAGLKAKGYTLVTVSTLLHRPKPGQKYCSARKPC